MTEPQPRPVMLVILDGWGWRSSNTENAVRLAHTPTFDRLWGNGPHAFLTTCGEDVGLPEGQFGNSEVGHLNIGAGRVVMQELPRITRAARDGSLALNPELAALMAAAKAATGVVHLVGLVSPGGVHAHQDHAVALAKILTQAGLTVMVHVITDGRDTPPRSGAGFVAQFEADLPPGATIATVSGRYHAMDRDNRWERVERAWDVMIDGDGPHFDTAAEAIDAGYGEDLGDEFLTPAVIGGYEGVQDGDALLAFNFRADRIRQLLTAFLDLGFTGFERPRLPRFSAVAGLTQYSAALDPFMRTLFPQISMNRLLGQVVADAGRRQLRMAETEKYPHVTYFLNGGVEIPNPGEKRIVVPSPKVATYDLQPEMSAPELTARAVAQIDSGAFRSHHPELRQSGHGRAYRRARRGDCGGRDGGPGPRRDRGGRHPRRRRASRHRRPRQLRADAGSGDAGAPYRPYAQPGAGDADGRPCGGRARRWAARRRCADAAGADGPAPAAGDDRRQPVAERIRLRSTGHREQRRRAALVLLPCLSLVAPAFAGTPPRAADAPAIAGAAGPA